MYYNLRKKGNIINFMNREFLEKILIDHPEVEFVSYAGIDIAGNDTDERIPVKMFIKDIDAMLKTGVQTDGSSVHLPRIADLNNAKVDMALNIDVPFSEIVDRIANRRSCRGCSAIYNVVFNPPKQEGICDECGGELYQREDQKPEVVQNRLEVYKNSSEELITYYSEKNVLRTEKAGDAAGRTSYDVAAEIEKELK